MITATGALLTVSATSNPELLYALKGAGQHFFLVTSLTLRTSPLSALNSPDNKIWKTAAVFPATRIREVIQAIAPIAASRHPNTSGSMMVMKSPMGSGETVVLCSLIYLGSSEDANAHYAAIKALDPVAWHEERIDYTRTNDDFDPFCVTGSYKKHSSIGLPRVQDNPKVWEVEVQAYDAMVDTCGAHVARSMIALQWFGKAEEGRFEECAFAHRGALWIECVGWYEDITSATVMREWEAETFRIAKEGFEQREISSYQNATRETPIETRFPGEGRLERLKALKKKWDPDGVFTKEFL